MTIAAGNIIYMAIYRYVTFSGSAPQLKVAIKCCNFTISLQDIGRFMVVLDWYG